jgi:hypothetical protein
VDERKGRRRRGHGRSASADIEDDDGRGRPSFFEEVDEDRELPEFEPVDEPGPSVVWEEDGEHMQRRWEELLTDLFGPVHEGAQTFEEVSDGLDWSAGEVIWEGMDFDEVFGGPDEFHAFELLSAQDKKRYLRKKLQASGAADATDTEQEARAPAPRPRQRPKPPRPAARREGPRLPSEASGAERLPGELESGLHGRGRRRRRGGA